MAFTIVNSGGRVIEVTGGSNAAANVIFGSQGTGPGAVIQTVHIARIRWVTAAPTAGDKVTLSDNAGNIIFESEAPATTAFQDEVELSKVEGFQGLKVTWTFTTNTGNVYIYLK